MARPDSPFDDALGIFRSVLGSVIVFGAAINVLMFVGPIYMLQVYDRVLQSRSEMTLIMLTAIAVGLLGVSGLLEWLRSRVLVRAGLQFDNRISGVLFNRVATLTLRQPQNRPEFVIGDIDRLREFLAGTGASALCDVPWTPIFLVVCFVFHPVIGWLATIGALIVFALAVINEVISRAKLNEASGQGRTAQHFVSNSLQNAEVMRAMGMEDALRNRWVALRLRMLHSQATASDRAGVVLSISKFVRMALQIAILGVGAYLVLRGELSAGVMIAASIMMGRALAPVDMVVGQWKQFVGVRQAYARLRELFDTVPPALQRTELPVPKGEVEIEGLAVATPGTKRPVLSDISLKLDAGEILAIAGPSGAGKSSLVRAMVGVWPPLAGTVRLDGNEIAHWNTEALGRHIGYLPQDVKLFSGTIAQNISRFSDAPAEEIIAAARLADVHELIQRLPEGYETEVGPGGQQLSGGQRQRIGLARALFGIPALIVLDEPNANLDLEGEEALVRAMRRLKEMGRTVVFVSHKIGLLSLSDKTLVLAEGSMRAYGPTRELLKPRQSIPPTQTPAEDVQLTASG